MNEQFEVERVVAIPESEINKFMDAIRMQGWKRGMSDAEAIAREINDGHDWPVTRAISKARDERKS